MLLMIIYIIHIKGEAVKEIFFKICGKTVNIYGFL